VDRTYVGRHDNYQELATAAILEGDESMHEKVRAVLRRLTKFPSASVEVSVACCENVRPVSSKGL